MSDDVADRYEANGTDGGGDDGLRGVHRESVSVGSESTIGSREIVGRDRVVEHFLTNEEVLCNRETHRLNETATEVYRVFGPQMLVAA